MKNYQTLRYEIRDQVGLLTLNRPERVNAINDRMLEDLEDFWMAQRVDPKVRVVIMKGAGENGFCAGIDLVDYFPQVVEADTNILYHMQARISRLILAMRQTPQPIIGAIHGAAVGGGLSFALGCCIRIITQDTRFAASYI